MGSMRKAQVSIRSSYDCTRMSISWHAWSGKQIGMAYPNDQKSVALLFAPGSFLAHGSHD